MPLALQEVQENSQRTTLGTTTGVLCPHIQARILDIPEDAILGARTPDSYIKVRMYLSDPGNSNAAIEGDQKFMEGSDFFKSNSIR